MLQVLQSVKTGETSVRDVPCPSVTPHHLLIRTHKTLISAGTERMLVDFGRANLLQKARQQPEKVRQVLDKIKTDGLATTMEAVRSQLEEPLPMGYCNVGEVLEIGEGVTGFSVGDRVVSNGPHAQVVRFSRNLCAKIPEGVAGVDAAFTVVGTVGLQGVRLLKPELGETVVVIGLGLIGLISVQLLLAQGCRVIGVDFQSDRVAMAREHGAEVIGLSQGADPVAEALAVTSGQGVDGVLITAATKSNEPVSQAARMCRKRGRIVLVGTAGMELSRSEFYEKELSFQVSCSYGPGRYDASYEQLGRDYPVGFVRWTVQRNFEAFLQQIAAKRIALASLVSHRFEIEQAPAAYEVIVGKEPSLGVLLGYPSETHISHDSILSRTVYLNSAFGTPCSAPIDAPVIGVIGAGGFATRMLIPAFRSAGAKLKAIACSGGYRGVHAARKFGFKEVTTDVDALIEDPGVHAVVIATRHDTHADFVCRALKAGKHVFVEKPLALNHQELDAIERLYQNIESSPAVMVGFNRRFAPQIDRMSELLSGVGGPITLVMTVNAGAIPADHWTQDPKVGGGRIIGEACHYIDLMRYLVGHPIASVQAHSVGESASESLSDTVSFSLKFTDGSLATVQYISTGHRSFPKERLEVFAADRVLQLDNFRKMRGYGWPGFRSMNLWRQDKGHRAGASAFVDAIRSGQESPIPFEQLLEVTRVSFEVARLAASSGQSQQPLVFRGKDRSSCGQDRQIRAAG